MASTQWNGEDEAAYANEMGESGHKLDWGGEDEEITFGYGSGLEYASDLKEEGARVAASFEPVVPVTTLDVDRYTGRWYQVIHLRLAAPLRASAGRT